MPDSYHADRSSGKASTICFGLDRATDEQSLKLFLEKLTAPDLLGRLLPRLSDAEILETADFLTALLRNHLSGKEYHQLFLADRSSPDRD